MSQSRRGQIVHKAMSADEEDDLLVLCSVVEEYKEALEIKEAQNASLERTVQRLTTENAMVREEAANQARVVSRLDESVRQLHVDLEQLLGLLSSKESDLHNLQHCLSVVHKKKVEVDDVAAHQRVKAIEQLTREKASISEKYSASQQIMEDHLDLVNSKDSEILDLRGAIKRLRTENQTLHDQVLGYTLTSSPPPPAPTGAVVSSRANVLDNDLGGKPSPLSNNLKPARRLHAKPAHTSLGKDLNQACVSRGTGPGALQITPPRRSSTSSFDPNLNGSASQTQTQTLQAPNSGVRPAVVTRARTSSPATQPSPLSISANSDDDDGSPMPVVINRNISRRVEDQPVSKYMRYVPQVKSTSQSNLLGQSNLGFERAGGALKSRVSGNDGGWGSTIGMGVGIRIEGAEGEGDISSSRGWSQVGRHDGLFGAADIIKSKDVLTGSMRGEVHGSGRSSVCGQTQGQAQAQEQRILGREAEEFGDFLLTVDSNPNSPERYPPSTGPSVITGGVEEKWADHRRERGRERKACLGEYELSSPASSPGSPSLQHHHIYTPSQPPYLNARTHNSKLGALETAITGTRSSAISPASGAGVISRGPAFLRKAALLPEKSNSERTSSGVSVRNLGMRGREEMGDASRL